jgi:hypothetical protein
MKRKEEKKEKLLKCFIYINAISFLVFACALDSENIAAPIIIILINLACIFIGGLFY